MMQFGKNLFHFIKVFMKVEKPSTQTTVLEQQAVHKYCADKSTAIEIGVFEGYNTVLIGNALRQSGKVYGIDPFFNGKLGVSFGKLIAELYVKRNQLQDKVILIAKLSNEAIDDVPANIDFIFVDGDHSFEGVKNDFQNFSGLLAKDGVIAFHDARMFDNGWTRPDWGPVRLVEEVIKPSNEWDIIEEVDSLVVLRKKHAVAN